MSLADDFLADLDYEDAEAITSTDQQDSTDFSAFNSSTSGASKTAGRNGDLMDEDGDDEDNDDVGDLDMDDAMNEADTALEAMMREVQSAKDARDIARLMDSAEMKGILKEIAHFQSQAASKGSDVSGMVEDDPEYQLIVKANTITVAIDNEVLVVHKVK
ncbi:U4/U6 small nuclear ribonucleoprotein Prp31 [Linnemannia exigua]|uniref:U4/U6 small nuclear ribonucleoprotein Prp31 n=1 Tax=Linnemannia exigua TaxID=604196 RepID=A0AAD4D104_9FUNG|nr:U4/U6 small nuclear ribonucleoprotein Prp31 [Linnemannia exigua]